MFIRDIEMGMGSVLFDFLTQLHFPLMVKLYFLQLLDALLRSWLSICISVHSMQSHCVYNNSNEM